MRLLAVRPWPQARSAGLRMSKGACKARRRGPRLKAPSFQRAGHSAIRVQQTNGPWTVWESTHLRQIKGENIPSRARCYWALPGFCSSGRTTVCGKLGGALASNCSWDGRPSDGSIDEDASDDGDERASAGKMGRMRA